jgi:hypothetical protein
MRPILQARMAGRRPAELVHVTNWLPLADFCHQNRLPTVYAEPLNDPAWDWRALHGLDVVVVGINGVPDMPTLKAVRPSFLRLLGPHGWQHLSGVSL